MNATRFEIRCRALIIILLYVIGLVAPWHFADLGRSEGQGESWGVLIAQLSRTHLLSFNHSFVMVNAVVLACTFAGGLLRWWATARAQTGTIGAGTIGAGTAGLWLLAVPVAILMRPSGAAFLMITLMLFLLRLAGAQKALLSVRASGSEPVGIVLPGKPDWAGAAVVECYGLLLAAAFAIFCWSFNAQLLLRCAIISFGISLVVNAVFVPRRTSRPGSPVIY